MVTQTLSPARYQPTPASPQCWNPRPGASLLLSPAVCRPVFRLVCSELNSLALLSSRYFMLINRKKMKQEPAQKVRSRLGVEGGGLGVQSGALWSRGGGFSAQTDLVLGPGRGEEREAPSPSLTCLADVIKASRVTHIPQWQSPKTGASVHCFKRRRSLDFS